MYATPQFAEGRASAVTREAVDDAITVPKLISSLTAVMLPYNSSYDIIPTQVNQTALALLLRQFQQEQECAFAERRCEKRFLHRALMGYGCLVVFCLALVGNCLNLLICNSNQIRFYIAIRMLCTKLLMNTLTMTFLVPQAFRIIELWQPGSPSDLWYWKFWPYQAYFINVFGFCAMWLTVLMTAECYLYIFFPGQSKALCTKRNLYRGYAAIGIAALILALIYPLNRTVRLKWQCGKLLISIAASQSHTMAMIERVHTVANLLFAIILPLTLLVFMTFSIVWRLTIRPIVFGTGNGDFDHFGYVTPQHFSAEKRGVTRITLITTLLQLITETPSVPVLIFAMLFGPNIAHHLCAWQTISHFLGLCNASLSFFLYLTFINRFRNLIVRRSKLLVRKFSAYLSSGMRIFLRNPSDKLRNFVSSRTNSFANEERDARFFRGIRGAAPTNSGISSLRASTRLHSSQSDCPLNAVLMPQLPPQNDQQHQQLTATLSAAQQKAIWRRNPQAKSSSALSTTVSFSVYSGVATSTTVTEQSPSTVTETNDKSCAVDGATKSETTSIDVNPTVTTMVEDSGDDVSNNQHQNYLPDNGGRDVEKLVKKISLECMSSLRYTTTSSPANDQICQDKRERSFSLSSQSSQFDSFL